METLFSQRLLLIYALYTPNGSEVQYARCFEIDGGARADVCPAQDESSQHAKQHQLVLHAMRREKHTEQGGERERDKIH